MRSLGSLLKGGFRPYNGQEFYKSHSEVPCLKCAGVRKKSRKEKFDRGIKFDFDPYNHDDLDKYYIHPYYPGEIVKSVKIVKPLPFFKYGHIYQLENGFLKFKDLVKFSEVEIYMYPTFFRPVY